MYRKPTHTNLYTHFSSFSSYRARSSVLQFNTRRALGYCSTEGLLKDELGFIEDTAVANGWPRSLAKREISSIEGKIYREDLAKLRDPVRFENERLERRDENNKKVRMSLPFPGHNFSHQLRRVCRKYEVEPVYRAASTIRDRIVRLKDPLSSNETAGVIYEIPLNCGKVYIGETGRKWAVRKTDHNKNILERNIKGSAIVEHLSVCGQVCGKLSPRVIWGKCRILEQEVNTEKRQALESIHIRLNKGNTVNRNLGSLDKIWDRAIWECNKREGRWKKTRIK